MSKWGLMFRYSPLTRRFKRLKYHSKQLLLASTLSSMTTIARESESDHLGGSGRGPPPIRVGFTEAAGRGVFATRMIRAGELIHTAKPLICHPSHSTFHSVCYFCLRRLPECDTIGTQVDAAVRFCSEECQEQAKVFYDVEKGADWSAYHEYCWSHGLKYPLLVKRLACMVISGSTPGNIFDILQPSILSPEVISKMDEGFSLLRSAFMGANISYEKMAFLTKQWYAGILARIRVNAFRIELAGGLHEDLFSLAAASVEAEAAVGIAVYMLPSFYNHDCDPNAHIIWIENVDARLKALCDVNPGEELRICYIDASMNHEARQTSLSEGFGFKCNCLRCLSGD